MIKYPSYMFFLVLYDLYDQKWDPYYKKIQQQPILSIEIFALKCRRHGDSVGSTHHRKKWNAIYDNVITKLAKYIYRLTRKNHFDFLSKKYEKMMIDSATQKKNVCLYLKASK